MNKTIYTQLSLALLAYGITFSSSTFENNIWIEFDDNEIEIIDIQVRINLDSKFVKIYYITDNDILNAMVSDIITHLNS